MEVAGVHGLWSRREFLTVVASGATAGARSGHARHFPLPRFDQYTPWTFPAHGISRKVFSAGDGPDVVVLHEITGPSELFFGFCDILVAAHFRVHCPALFGTPNAKENMIRNALLYVPACLDHAGINCFRRSHPDGLDPWLIALADSVSGPNRRPVGAIGMCYTGIKPLAMLRSRGVIAPVLCQPALPFGERVSFKKDLGLAPSDLDYAVARSREESLDVLALRYSDDRISPPERMRRLIDLFGDRLRCLELQDADHKHSTLVHERDERAIQAVLGFLRERLT
jgi:dienelactone hydrolase